MAGRAGQRLEIGKDPRRALRAQEGTPRREARGPGRVRPSEPWPQRGRRLRAAGRQNDFSSPNLEQLKETAQDENNKGLHIKPSTRRALGAVTMSGVVNPQSISAHQAWRHGGDCPTPASEYSPLLCRSSHKEDLQKKLSMWTRP